MASSRCACLICSTCSGGELGDARDAERGRDDRRSGRRDAVLGEGRVVRRGIAGQMIKKVLADGRGQLVTGELVAAEA